MSLNPIFEKYQLRGMNNVWLGPVLSLILFICGSQLVQSKIYLVSVGIADYTGFPQPVNNLKLTVRDAKTIAAIYAINGNTEYSLLLDSQAKKENILKSIRDLFSKAGKEDIAVFFFSGHGYIGGFCAYDDIISYDMIRDAMKKSECQNKMMLIDACHSGGIRIQNSNNGNDINRTRNSNVMLFLSSRTDEYSIERSDMQNGYFTAFLQKGLRGNADANHDRVITARELFKFVSRGVADISDNQQHPVMWGKFRDNMPVLKW